MQCTSLDSNLYAFRVLRRGAMLESGSDAIKRHSASASFRNRPLNRRNFRDRLDRSNSPGDDNGDRALQDSSNGARKKEAPRRFETNSFNSSEALRIMADRWTTVLNSQDDPTLDEVDRPVVHCGSESTSVWGSSKLGLQASVTDFLAELGQAVHRANTAKTNL